jgi:hypothetical protein
MIMKIKVVLAILVITAIGVNAQESDTINDTQEKVSTVIIDDNENEISIETEEFVKAEKSSDTTKIGIGDKNISIIEDDEGTSIKVTDSGDDEEKSEKSEIKKKKFKGHWSGIEFGINNFVDNKFSMDRTAAEQFMDLNTGRSWNFNWNIKQYSIGFGSNRFGLVSGLGLEFNSYHFDGDNNIQELDGNIVSKTDYPSPLEKSKLKTTFLRVPVLLELQLLNAKRSKRVYISGGVIGGLKLGSSTKVIYKEDGKKQKDKIRDDFNINPLRYGLTARIGYRNLNVFGNYYLTPFFEKDNDPELYPISIGLSFSF